VSISSRLICLLELPCLNLDALADLCLITSNNAILETASVNWFVSSPPPTPCTDPQSLIPDIITSGPNPDSDATSQDYCWTYINHAIFVQLNELHTNAALSGAVTQPTYDSTPHQIMPATEILDIRVGKTEFDILQDIKKGLRPADGGEKKLPTLLLYDEAGLRLFEKITYLEEYYLTNAEIEVLETYAERIAQHIQPGSIVVELGSG